METREYEVTIKEGKEEREVSIEIDLDEYGEAFAENAYHLQEYPESVAKPTIDEDKITFLREQVKKQVGDDVSIGKREIKRLMKEVDADYQSYREEVEGYLDDDDI